MKDAIPIQVIWTEGDKTTIAAMSFENERGRETIELVGAGDFFYCCRIRLRRTLGFTLLPWEINTLLSRKFLVYL